MLARQIAVGLGIALLLPLLIYYGVATFYPPPQPAAPIAIVVLPPNATPEERQRYLEQQQERQKQTQEQQAAYRNAAKDFARRLIIVSMPSGLAAILIGAYIPIHAIGTGLILGGILTLAWGYWGYWTYFEDWMRFASLCAGLMVLVFVGFRRTRRLTTERPAHRSPASE